MLGQLLLLGPNDEDTYKKKRILRTQSGLILKPTQNCSEPYIYTDMLIKLPQKGKKDK